MPARLADGLGHGSDLGHGYPRPFAPSSKSFEESGSPALALRKESQLRLHLLLGGLIAQVSGMSSDRNLLTRGVPPTSRESGET